MDDCKDKDTELGNHAAYVQGAAMQFDPRVWQVMKKQNYPRL